MTANPDAWENHYTKGKSILTYPDENLVRLLKSFLVRKKGVSGLTAIDLGCGSGRHLKLLEDLGIRIFYGMDYSINALLLCKEQFSYTYVQADNKFLPIKNNSFDIVISWGSLHYCEKSCFNNIIEEIYRVIRRGGRFFGTLRSERDTYLKNGIDMGEGTWITQLSDIKNSVVSFFSEDELRSALNLFSRYKYGIMERTDLGDVNRVISHWFFWAEK